MPEQRVNLTMKEVVKVAQLVTERDKIDAAIREITGLHAPIKESTHPEKAAASAPAPAAKRGPGRPKKDPNAPPSAKRQAHGRYMAAVRSLLEPLKSQAMAINKEQGPDAAVAFIESNLAEPQKVEGDVAPWDEMPETQDVVDV
jgi:hypothetical protein